MQINVEIDARHLATLLELGVKRLAYGVVNAINTTAKAIQDAERDNVRREFVLRKADFVLREAAVLKPFASVRQARPFAEISVGQKPRLLLSTFEAGGERVPARGRKAAAVPIPGGPARPTFPSQVPTSYRFGALRLTKSRLLETTTASGKRRRSKRRKDAGVRYGLLGTYQVPDVGVFQRRPGEDRARLVYAFAENQQIERRLGFVATARIAADRVFNRAMEDEVVKALAFRR